MERYIRIYEGELTTDDEGYIKIDGQLVDDLFNRSLLEEEVRLTIEVLKNKS